MAKNKRLVLLAAFAVFATVASATGALAVDPKDSIGVADQTTGIWYLRSPDGDTTSFYFGNPGDFPIMGDWDCDGIDTPGLYRQADGYVYLRNSNTQGPADIKFFFGNPGDIPLAGDFNADGCDTVSIYRPAQARIFVINKLGSDDGGLGAADYDFYFGNPGDKAFTADFNNNGQDTVGLHRESTGFVYYRNTLTTGNAHNDFFFGNPDDQIVTGRWVQNPNAGPDTVGIFRPGQGKFYLRFSNSQGNADAEFAYGNSDMAAVAGRFGSLPGGDTPPPTNPPPTTTLPPAFTFGSGTWRINSDIPDGTYRNTNSGSGCYWARLSGFSGTIGDIIANNFDDVLQIVEIKPTDAGFENSRCGTWSTDLTPLKAPTASFGGGTWQAGSEVAPGRWRNTDFSRSSGCYWERLSGFSGEPADRLANNFDDVRQIVDVKPGDVGFYAGVDCGIWSMDLSPSKPPTASFGGGTWLVNSEVAPGVWRNAPAETGCYWERLSGFSGDASERLANDFIPDASPQTVTISATDTGFYADRSCGNWQYLGP